MRLIAGSFGGRTLKTVTGPGYRPATAKVRGAVFSMLEARGTVWGGTRVLDLFAGSGSLGFEALSRGASEAWFVESAPAAAACLQRVAQGFDLGPERCRIVRQDVAVFLRSGVAQPFDVIFVDPPYGQGRLSPTLKAVVQGRWCSQDGFVLAEIETTLPFDPAGWPSLAVEADRTYGQTRILAWRYQTSA